MRRRAARTAWLLLALLVAATVLAVLLAALDPTTAPSPRRPYVTTTGGTR
jgi:ABC-type transporter Mla subunit MlaD